MQRAKTLTGLLFQTLRLRWAALGSRGKMLALIGLVLTTAVALHVGACFLGACPASSPCERASSDEPCPYSQPAPEAADEPCHMR